MAWGLRPHLHYLENVEAENARAENANAENIEVRKGIGSLLLAVRYLPARNRQLY